jgi:hypothetical protein
MRENFDGIQDFHITHEIQMKTGITMQMQPTRKLEANLRRCRKI